NLAISLAIQLIPFLSITGLHFNSIVMCEPFLVFAIQGIALQLALYCFADKGSPGNGQILLLAFFTAIGLTTKIIFIPVFLLPFFVINGWTHRFKYIFITFFISAILLISAYPDWHLFVNWFKMLLFHKGIYGYGESGVVDIDLFIYSLKEIFSTDLLFSLLFVLILLYLSMRLVPGIKENIHRKNYRMVVGIIIVIIIQLLMIGKHYLPHYLISVYSLVMIALLFSFTGFKKLSFLTKYSKWLYSLTVVLAGIFLIIRFLQSFHFSPNFRHPFTETVNYVNNNVGDKQRIIVEGFSSAFKEYGLYFGLVFSSRSINKYRPVLKKLYPETFFYNISQDRYFDWISNVSPVEILSLNKTTYLFRKSRTDTIPAILLDELLYFRKAGFIIAFNLEYKNPIAFDYLYKIESDTNALKKFYIEKETIICDCESIGENGDVFVSANGEFTFEKAYMRSLEQVHDGQYAVKLDVNNPYALDIRLKVNKNDYIKTFAWRNAQDDKGKIVLTDDIPNSIYSAGSAAVQTQDGWQRINLNFRIPAHFQGEEIHLYLWHNGKDSCYFDDFEIRIFEGMQIKGSDL
ncbi:MAG TPA: hypothetical protein VJ346_08140, partial [Bacteroidales bacterium]|nr:hypothetical protein [Bacteroidales bacterium]